ncbi:MAG: glycosyltransferase family 9 protein [Pseudomonadota bacterium]
MQLLVVMPSKYLGNMVISLQTIRALIEGNGAQDTTLLIDQGFVELVGLVTGDAHRLLVFPRKRQGALGRLGRLLLHLRRHRYDCVLDLDGTVISARIVSLAKARRKVGPQFAKRTAVYTEVVANERDVQHCFEDFALMSEAIGIPLQNRDYARLPELADTGLPLDLDSKMACIHPSATKDYKQWDIHKFAELADWLTEHGYTPVIVGAGAAEASRVARLVQLMRHPPMNMFGQLSLLQLIELCQRSRVFIGNDSGPMHLAAASGTTTIALFGPTELLRWKPRATNAITLKGPAPCSPDCRPEACLRNYQCLTSLDTDQVKAAILSNTG